MNNPTFNKIISINELWKFFNGSANLFCITGANGFLRQVNPHVSEILGYSESELLSLPYLNFIHDDDKELSIAHSKKIRNGYPVNRFTNRLVKASGESIYVSWTANYIQNENNVYLIGHDITQEHLMEEKLKEEKINRHKNILEATLLAQENERTEIGKELHDNITQMLATVNLYHQMALDEMDDSNEYIIKGNAIVKQTISEIRKLSKSLVGPDTRQIGLVECINELTSTISLTLKISIVFRHSGSLEKLPVKVKFSIFRILQELINNITKYAQADNVLIELIRGRKNVTLSVRDDGVGFDLSEKKNGIGLNNIHSRVEIYNGKMEVDSLPGKGCYTVISFPLLGMIDKTDG